MRGTRPVHALLAAALLSATWLARPPIASAQPAATGEGAEERRTRLFKEGKAAADAGQWLEAAAKFRQVVAIRSAPKALIALGVAEEHLGHLVAAQTVYKQAREEAAEKTLTDDLRTVNSALEALRPRIPRLTFSPPGALAGATLEIDGAPVTPPEEGLPVDPGDHIVSATSPGKGTFRTSVSVKEGDRRDVAVTFGTTAPAPSGTTDPGPSDARRSAAPPTGALMIGLPGLVLVGVGGALYGSGSGQYTESEKLCPGVTCSAEVAGKGNDGRSQMIIGDVFMVVGAAAAVTAGIYWAVSATSKKPSPTSFFIAPRAAGIELGGRF